MSVMSAVATHEVAAPVRRLSVLDGLRGAAIVLVVLSHGWILWPTEWIDQNAWARLVFRNGNFAVTVFLFASGYLTYRSLASRGLGRSRLGVALGRRVLRIAPITLVVLPVILLVAALDAKDTTTSHANAQSAWHILTFTWNWYLQTDLAYSRWDLGHLWYLSVDMQAFMFSAMVIHLLRRQPWGLVLTLVGLLLLFTWWRFHVSGVEDSLIVLLRTTARIDAFLFGVLTAAVLAMAGPLTPRRRQVTRAALSALALTPVLAWYCSYDERFLRWGVTLFELDLAVLVGAAAMGAGGLGILSSRALVFLGRNSLPLYVWHYPAFAAVQRNTDDWGWAPRAAVALVVLTLLCVASHYLIERRVSRWLSSPWWDRPRGTDPDAQPAGATSPAAAAQGTQTR
jgi:peptidoglycan/LPS O-acetylase OafA/YrhL